MSIDSSTVPVGSQAPDFTLPIVGGEGATLTLSELRGSTVVLNFMRSFGCPFCIKHLGRLREENDEFAKRDAQVVVISPESERAGERYLKRNPSPFTMIGDKDHSVFDAYDVADKFVSLGQRPALFIIDAEGTVTYNQVGTQQWQIPPIDEILAVLDGDVVDGDTTEA